MKHILLMSHGNLALEIKNIMEEFFMSNYPISSIGLESNEDLAALLEKLNYFSSDKDLKNDEIYVLCDIKSGSPYNAANVFFKDYENTHIFYGLNLPMIFSIATSDNISLEEILLMSKDGIGVEYDKPNSI